MAFFFPVILGRYGSGRSDGNNGDDDDDDKYRARPMGGNCRKSRWEICAATGSAPVIRTPVDGRRRSVFFRTWSRASQRRPVPHRIRTRARDISRYAAGPCSVPRAFRSSWVPKTVSVPSRR